VRFIERAALAAAVLGLSACTTSRVPLTPSRPAVAAAAARQAEPEVPAAPARRARNWDEFRLQFAHRLVAANPDGIYLGEVVEPLLAIPVLEIELNANGSVRHIKVMRKPGQALDTIELAIAAVNRAAPFDSVGHLPRPWVFSEVFLFNNQRRFKPRVLDQ
jgi:hypothetical protein